MADTGKTIGLIKALASVDPEVIQSSVEGWLDDHPEATTTVQDGSITKAKLDQNLQSTVDDVGDLKSNFTALENATTVSVETISEENSYYADITELSTSKLYELAITVGTAGTYTIQTGTERTVGSMVDTLATSESFAANVPIRFYGYTPSATGIDEIRISSNSVSWSVAVKEIVPSSEIRDNAEDIADLEENLQSEADNISRLKSSVIQTADETLETGDNLYNILDGYSVENLYISSSNGKYSANNNYTLIVVPVEVQSGSTLYFELFESGTFTNADFRASVATTYPVAGGNVSAQTTMGTKRGFVALTENINYLLIGYLTSGYSGTVADIVKALTVSTTGWFGEYVPHYKPVNVSELESDISDLQDDVEGLETKFENVRTSQLFNKDATPGTLYVKTNGSIVSNTTVGKSWIVPLQPNKRYLAYSTQSVHGSFYISLCTSEPAAGGTVSRKDVAVIHNVYYTDFTTANDEVYALITYGSDFSYLATDVQRFGLEQIDSGHNYKNEPYTKAVLKADLDIDYISQETAMDVVEKAGGVSSKWKDKKIWWCGTSIPNGHDVALDSYGSGLTYPEMVGNLLGASVVYNEALGSSMARANVRTGDYVNAMSYNLLWSLSQTAEEKENLITNWSTIKSSLIDPNTFDSITGDTATITRNSTFENRLLPYLDGTKPMPDLFVFDHGHNDWKSYYTMPDGTTPDTELEPTVANIAGNILAEDIYMTANGNAKLISFFREIAHIPANKQAEFIASVNRNCFIGAINFLCTLILSYNPRARIVFIGNLDNWDKPQVQPAQEKVASSWNFPLIRMWEFLGFSNHYVPNTSTFWSESGTTDLIVKQIYCKDGIHPHSDTTGVAMELYAETIANALRNIV